MENLRNGYGFTNEVKQLARDRANGKCEPFFPYCERPNTNRVNHINGAYEGRLAKREKKEISSIDNTALLCGLHEAMHDLEEQDQIQVATGGIS